MRTVNEVSKLTGVSVRALHHYDAIGLLHPAEVTEAGYRLYDDTALERLQHILLFRELEFPLKEIRTILDYPGFDRSRAIAQQIELLQMKKAHIETLIDFARDMQKIGERNMDFTAFDTKKMDEYAAEAKAAWGETAAYREYEKKSAGRTTADEADIGSNMMTLFAEFGQMRSLPETDARVQSQVEKLRGFITEHYYNCSPEILSGLGQMYSCGGEMTDNIDKAGGEGTAAFVTKAIAAYCTKGK